MRLKSLLCLAAATALLPVGALAGDVPYDAPFIQYGPQGFGKVEVWITAGASGAPAGFTMYWMTESEFVANGMEWYPEGTPPQQMARFVGTPTLNTWDGSLTSFRLGADQTARVEVGDIFDETGIESNWRDELDPGESYVCVVYVNGDQNGAPSALSNVIFMQTLGDQDCTLTQGYWKNHPQVWPVNGLTLGTVTYTQAELLQILDQPAMGNGLIFLAHQLIATLLNIANGADPTAIQDAVDDAHALIGNLVVPPIGGDSLPPATASPLTQELDNYNNGITGPGHCPTPTQTTSWGALKSIHR